jgi:acetoin utilization deacetylase AcuC-like enzyme
MRVVYSRRYHIDIGPHVFPTIKYQLLFERLLQRYGLRDDDLIEPQPATWDELSLVHTAEYLHKVRTGTLTVEEIAQLEIPWAEEVVEGFRVMTGGTITAARVVMESGRPSVLAHLGGGFHHAFSNHGEGFCLFNDVAVAIRVLQAERGLDRAAVVDLDVHHGNGTAFIFETDRSVFTFSMHQQHNYPMFKPRGSLDIGLRDNAGDEEYLAALGGGLAKVMAFDPQVVFYLAGADPYRDDQLGGLGLTIEGLRARDRLVLGTCRHAHVPVVVTLAGGYARDVRDTVTIHAGTIEEVGRVAGQA